MICPRGVVAVLALLTTLAPPSLAGAAPADKAREDARAHADKGRRLYELRKYDDAIREFEEAWKLTGDPTYLYNLAQTHRQANHPTQAIQCYELYLQKVPAAPNRADIEQRIAELRKAVPPEPPAALATRPAGVTPAPSPAQPSPPPPPASVPPVAVAAPPPRDPGDRRHDRFFLRGLLGGGQTTMSATYQGSKLEFSGGTGFVNVAAGWAPTEHLAVFLETGSAATPDNRVKVDGSKVDVKMSTSVNGLIGVGAAYFLMPLNAYLSGTVTATRIDFELTDTHGDLTGTPGEKLNTETKVGPSVALTLGKEWWVGREFGIGAAALMQFSWNKEDDGTKWRSNWFGLAFSATYN